MKSEITKNGTPNTLPFPKLMHWNIGGVTITVVLMYDEGGEGVVVYAKDDMNYIGEYSADWNMQVFEDFYGTLTLSND